MKDSSRVPWMLTGFLAGVVSAAIYAGAIQPARAAGDRSEEYIICTGAVSIYPRSQTDGVWLLDYRNGKLQGTIIDRDRGKIVGWAEVDLHDEFSLAPHQAAHFMMTTGQVTQGQAALYVAETGSGKMGVYTMGSRTDGQAGVLIRRHDMTSFRQAQAKE